MSNPTLKIIEDFKASTPKARTNACRHLPFKVLYPLHDEAIRQDLPDVLLPIAQEIHHKNKKFSVPRTVNTLQKIRLLGAGKCFKAALTQKEFSFIKKDKDDLDATQKYIIEKGDVGDLRLFRKHTKGLFSPAPPLYFSHLVCAAQSNVEMWKEVWSLLPESEKSNPLMAYQKDIFDKAINQKEELILEICNKLSPPTMFYKLVLVSTACEQNFSKLFTHLACGFSQEEFKQIFSAKQDQIDPFFSLLSEEQINMALKYPVSAGAPNHKIFKERKNLQSLVGEQMSSPRLKM